MKREYAFQKAQRCSATSKRTRQRCRAFAVRVWRVCRFHGAHGGAPEGNRNGMYRHGLYTKEALEERRLLSMLLRKSRDALGTLQAGLPPQIAIAHNAVSVLKIEGGDCSKAC